MIEKGFLNKAVILVEIKIRRDVIKLMQALNGNCYQNIKKLTIDVPFQSSLEKLTIFCVFFDQIHRIHHQTTVRAFYIPQHRVHCNLHRSRYELQPRTEQNERMLFKPLTNLRLLQPYIYLLRRISVRCKHYRFDAGPS